MKFEMKAALLGVAGSLLTADAVNLRKPQASLASANQMTWRKQDCGKLVKKRNLHGKEEAQFVVKDGYYEVACVKDTMYYFGDKTGDNKDQYKIGDRLNTSIVLYDVETPKEDQEPVTPSMCFEFCRSKPGMGFFGLIHGRECYCMPFHEMEAGDSSQCDAVCDGDKATMCGGMTKSSIYQMHVCGGEVVKKRMDKAVAEAEEIGGKLMELAGLSKESADNLQQAASDYQDVFGQAGDPDASNLFQAAKVTAGKLVHAAEEASKLAESVDGTVDEAGALGDTLDDEAVKKAGPLTVTLDDFASDATKEIKKLTPIYEATVPPMKGDEGGVKASSQYKSVHWFLHPREEGDKRHDEANLDLPTTCTGTLVGEAIYGKSIDGCAAACDAQAVEGCVGFSFFTDVCFLLGDFKAAKYYKGCEAEVHPEAKCMAKLSHFENMNIAPDPSGKCEQCMKKLEGADRCY